MLWNRSHRHSKWFSISRPPLRDVAAGRIVDTVAGTAGDVHGFQNVDVIAFHLAVSYKGSTLLRGLRGRFLTRYALFSSTPSGFPVLRRLRSFRWCNKCLCCFLIFSAPRCCGNHSLVLMLQWLSPLLFCFTLVFCLQHCCSSSDDCC